MSNFTIVPNSALLVTKPIRSVDILAINGNTQYNYDHVALTLLETVTTFVANGTYIKPAGYDANDTILALIWGGGGSGAVSNGGGTNVTTGGGGGGFFAIAQRYADVASSVAVTVGAGGGAVSRSAGGGASNGLPGSASYFGLFGASGGAAGLYVATPAAAVAGAASGNPLYTSAALQSSKADIYSGDARSCFSDTTLFPRPLGFASAGGGAMARNAGTTVNTNFEAGLTIIGGAGGAGGNDGVNGTAPGGGGGAANRNGGSGNTNGTGARGEVRVYVLRGRVSPQQFLGF